MMFTQDNQSHITTTKKWVEKIVGAPYYHLVITSYNQEDMVFINMTVKAT